MENRRRGGTLVASTLAGLMAGRVVERHSCTVAGVVRGTFDCCRLPVALARRCGIMAGKPGSTWLSRRGTSALGRMKIRLGPRVGHRPGWGAPTLGPRVLSRNPL